MQSQHLNNKTTKNKDLNERDINIEKSKEGPVEGLIKRLQLFFCF
jgi:hypothetical protein